MRQNSKKGLSSATLLELTKNLECRICELETNPPVLHTVDTIITTNQILNGHTNTINLVPDTGDESTLGVYVAALVKYNHNTTSFTTGGASFSIRGVNYSTYPGPLINDNLESYSADKIISTNTSFSGHSIFSGFEFFTGGAYTLGDGTLTVKLFYYLLDIETGEFI